MLRRADRVIRMLPGDLVGLSRWARGDVSAEVDGVLDGVGVLSDSSESLSSCDLPRHIRSTIGGLDSSRFATLFTFGLSTVVLSELFLEVKNFLELQAFLGSATGEVLPAFARLVGDT